MTRALRSLPFAGALRKRVGQALGATPRSHDLRDELLHWWTPFDRDRPRHPTRCKAPDTGSCGALPAAHPRVGQAASQEPACPEPMSDRTPKPTEGVEELAATSNDILDTLERLRELEKERRSEQPTSVRFRELAGEIERLSNDIFRSAVKET